MNWCLTPNSLTTVAIADTPPKKSADVETRYLIATAISCVDALAPKLQNQPPGIIDRLCGCEIDHLRRERLAGRDVKAILDKEPIVKTCTDFALANPKAPEEPSPFSKGLKYRSVLIIRTYAGCFRDSQTTLRTPKEAADLCICRLDDVRKGKEVPDLGKALRAVPQQRVDRCLQGAGS